MDLFVFIISLVLGLTADFFLGGWLNWPGIGAIVSISFVGARAIWYLRKIYNKSSSGAPQEKDRNPTEN